MTTEHPQYQLVDAACAFWFGTSGSVRTPFPLRIHEELKKNALASYLDWLRNLTETDRNEVDDDELASVFESFLFNEALSLLGEEDTDLVLTIHHPFMPRIGDSFDDPKNGFSKVVERTLTQKGEDELYMVLALENASKERWEK